MIWAAIFKAMMGLGLSLAIEKVASAGTAPPPPTGSILQADLSDQTLYEGWAFWW
jgi:hypothetical protein